MTMSGAPSAHPPSSRPVRLRVAPSPTGNPHVGTVHGDVRPRVRPSAGRTVRAADRGHRPGEVLADQRAGSSTTRCTGSASPGTRGPTSVAPTRRTASRSGSPPTVHMRTGSSRRARPITAGALPSGSRRCARSSSAPSSRRGTTDSASGSPGTDERICRASRPNRWSGCAVPRTSSSSSTTSSWEGPGRRTRTTR